MALRFFVYCAFLDLLIKGEKPNTPPPQKTPQNTNKNPKNKTNKQIKKHQNIIEIHYQMTAELFAQNRLIMS